MYILESDFAVIILTGILLSAMWSTMYWMNRIEDIKRKNFRSYKCKICGEHLEFIGSRRHLKRYHDVSIPSFYSSNREAMEKPYLEQIK